jgi:uncharacterized protein with PhoU and TrkA domain
MFLRAEALLSGGDDALRHDAPAHEALTLDILAQFLDRDYRVIAYLLHNAAEYRWFQTFEQLVLSLDFQLMLASFRMFRGVSHRLARNAVLEMAAIVRSMAQSAGERLVAG